MQTYSPEEIKSVVNGLIAGLRSGGVDEEQIAHEVSAEYRKIINAGWASAEMMLVFAEEIEVESGIAPPRWLQDGGVGPDPQQVQF